MAGTSMATIKIAPVKPTISIDLFEKVDIRVGTIKLVEDVEGSDKLIKMTVDFGDHTRTILVGTRNSRHHQPRIQPCYGQVLHERPGLSCGPKRRDALTSSCSWPYRVSDWICFAPARESPQLASLT